MFYVSVCCSERYGDKNVQKDQIDWSSWGLNSRDYIFQNFEPKALLEGRGGYQKLTVIAKDQSYIIIAFKHTSTGCVGYMHFFQNREY